MHALCFVVIPPEGNPVDHVAAALAPWYEGGDPAGWWDWYQIGGRWTGHLSDYDPRDDPANTRPCRTCSGTGCNACRGTGMETLWPTMWAPHEGDVATLDHVLAAIATDPQRTIPHTLVAGERVLHRETWDGGFVVNPDHDQMVAETLAAADPSWRVVVVDYHS